MNRKLDHLDNKLKTLPTRDLNEKHKEKIHQNLMNHVTIHKNKTMKERIVYRLLISLGSGLLLIILLLILYYSMNVS